MSGAFGGVPNQFANAVTATGLQLDQNNNTLTAYLNDPTNRNNYAAAGGSTNTLNITFAPPVISGYSAGLELAWKWNVSNTGAVVMNANGVGNASLVNPDGSALIANQGVVGSIGKAVYDGTRFIYISGGVAGVSSQLARAWASWNGTSTGTISALSSFNVSQIVRTGTGSYSISFTAPFTAFPTIVTNATNRLATTDPSAASNTATANIIVFTTGGTQTDATYVAMIAFGLT
jgi:hypothetical protein